MATPLGKEEIERALQTLPGWKFEDDGLRKTFRFGDFKEALSFLVRIGLHAEVQNHHPEIHNVYATVNLVLRTHDAGNKVTERDLKLAKTIEKVNWVG